MKKILFIFLCCILSSNIFAQVSTNNELLDSMLANKEEIETMGEKEFSANGIKSDFSIYFDKQKKELVMCFEFYTQEIFNSMDIVNMKKGSVQNMVGAVMTQDPSSKNLEYLISLFKNSNTKIRYKIVYQSQVKEEVADYHYIRKIGNLFL